MTLELAHVNIDCGEPEQVAAFWSAALGRPVDPGGNGFFVSIGEQQPTPGQVAWFFLRVPEPKSGKNRVHVDLKAADRRAEVARLQGLGATVVDEYDEWGVQWTVLSDVEGNEFCVVSDLTLDPEAAEPTGPRHGDIAYASLWVPDVERASAFFSSVLGWRLAPGSAPQGRHVEATTPGHGLWGGQERSNLMLCFAVDDIDLALERVRAAGGRTDEPRREPYGVIADSHDRHGTAFSLVEAAAGPATAAAPPANARAGDIAYLVLEVVDAAEARAFYASVLGWHFTEGRTEGGWEAHEVVPMVGLVGGRDTPTVVPMYRVDDIADAVERVRTAGGAATDPQRQPYGITSDCTDDQGTRFYLGQL